MKAALVATIAALVTSCSDSTHDIVIRVEGGSDCVPDVTIRVIANGNVSSKDFNLSSLPLEKHLDSHLDGVTVYASNYLPGGCPLVQCQIIVDGKPVVIRADAKLPTCEWHR